MAQTFFDDGDFQNKYDENTKKCWKCQEVKLLTEYSKNSKNKDGYHNYCKECMAKNDHRRYENNKEKFAEHHQEYKIRAKDVIVEGRKKRYQKIKDTQAAYYKIYRKTPKGKEVNRKNYARRKSYGFNPLNKPFEGADFHHLHVDFEGNEDHEIGLYIPHELHNSIYHNCKTWEGMDEMNELALKWYISTGE